MNDETHSLRRRMAIASRRPSCLAPSIVVSRRPSLAPSIVVSRLPDRGPGRRGQRSSLPSSTPRRRPLPRFAKTATPKVNPAKVATAYPSTPVSMAGTTSDRHPLDAAIAAAVVGPAHVTVARDEKVHLAQSQLLADPHGEIPVEHHLHERVEEERRRGVEHLRDGPAGADDDEETLHDALCHALLLGDQTPRVEETPSPTPRRRA